jgi:hypothetical protein
VAEETFLRTPPGARFFAWYAEPEMARKRKRQRGGDYTVIAIVAVAAILFVLFFLLLG